MESSYKQRLLTIPMSKSVNNQDLQSLYNESEHLPLNLDYYMHNYFYIDDDIAIINDEEANYFTEADVNAPKVLVSAPPNSPFADAISPSTMNILAVLAENNHPGLLNLYKDEWKAAKKDFGGFLDILGQELYHDIDQDTPWKTLKVLIHKSRRTDNFGNTKYYHTSLKSHFKPKTYVKALLLGRFISIKPGNNSTVTVGILFIPVAIGVILRDMIMKEAHLLDEVLSTEYVKQVFGTSKVGISLLDTTGMKPGLPPHIDHDTPNAHLYKFHHYAVVKHFSDMDVVSSGFMDKVLDIYAALTPFMALLYEWQVNASQQLGNLVTDENTSNHSFRP